MKGIITLVQSRFFTFIGIYFISFIILLPIFFLIYRLTAFDTLPIDPYWEGLLYLDGRLPNFILYSPTCYRFLYHAIAFLFYKTLPLIPFSYFKTDIDIHWLKAVQSLAFTAFIYYHLFLFTAGNIVYRQIRQSIVLTLAVVSIVITLSFFTFFYSIDSLFLFYTTFVIYNLKKFNVFSVLLPFSIIVNEKISLLFTCYFLLAFLFSYSLKVRKYLIISILSLGLYFLMKQVLNFPGYEYQTDPSMFFKRLAISIPFLLSFKGAYMNILPLTILLSLSLILKRNKIFDAYSLLLNPAIIFMPILFFIIGMHVSSDYGIGRAAMHALPLYIYPLANLLDLELNKVLVPTVKE